MPDTIAKHPPACIETAILVIRGEKVMLDADLATLYGVETKVLVQAVKRNLDRFPADFMFQLTKEEFDRLRDQVDTQGLRSQSVTSRSGGRGGRRYPPYAFTEQGVAMLSSVLRSRRAVAVHIEIMRTFVRLRQMLLSHEELARKLEKLETRYDASPGFSPRIVARARRCVQILAGPQAGARRHACGMSRTRARTRPGDVRRFALAADPRRGIRARVQGGLRRPPGPHGARGEGETADGLSGRGGGQNHEEREEHEGEEVRVRVSTVVSRDGGGAWKATAQRKDAKTPGRKGAWTLPVIWEGWGE